MLWDYRSKLIMFQIQIYHQKAQFKNIQRLRGLSFKVRASLPWEFGVRKWR